MPYAPDGRHRVVRRNSYLFCFEYVWCLDSGSVPIPMLRAGVCLCCSDADAACCFLGKFVLVSVIRIFVCTTWKIQIHEFEGMLCRCPTHAQASSDSYLEQPFESFLYYVEVLEYLSICSSSSSSSSVSADYKILNILFRSGGIMMILNLVSFILLLALSELVSGSMSMKEAPLPATSTVVRPFNIPSDLNR